MAASTNLSLQSIYDTINDLQAKIIKNSEDIVFVTSKLQLATPKQISNMLIDINNLQHEISVLNDKLTKLQTNLIQFNGKFNQSIIKTNQLSNRLTDLKQQMNDNSNKFFSWATGREILIGIVLAAILSILRSISF